jgi:hypothetical protein
VPLPEFVRTQAEAAIAEYCLQMIPRRYWNKLRVSYELRRGAFTIFEDRPRFDNPAEWTHLAVAQLRFDSTTGTWSLFWRDRHERWHPCTGIRRPKTVAPLLAEVDRDPTGIFWG